MAVYLSEADKRYIKSEDEEYLEHLVTRTDLKCSVCTNTLHLVEEMFEFKIIQAQLVEGELVYYDALDNNSILYPAHYFDFKCWEEVEEEIESRHENTPPMKDQLALLSCDLCGSDIRELEILGLVRFGELHCSPRTPQGIPETVFENMGRDKHICIGCITNINDGWDLWADDVAAVPGVDVCREGIFERCWRKDECHCKWHM